jgi:hypothetical protein
MRSVFGLNACAKQDQLASDNQPNTQPEPVVASRESDKASNVKQFVGDSILKIATRRGRGEFAGDPTVDLVAGKRQAKQN